METIPTKENFEQMTFKEVSAYKDDTLKALGKFVEEHKDSATGQWKMTGEEIKHFNEVHEHLGKVTERWETLRVTDARFQKVQEELRASVTPSRTVPHPGAQTEGAGSTTAAKSAGELFTESDEYKNHRGQYNAQYTVEIDDVEYTGNNTEAKATITTAAGFAPRYDRLGRVVETALRRPMVSELMPNTNTPASQIIFMEETTFTNNAAGLCVREASTIGHERI